MRSRPVLDRVVLVRNFASLRPPASLRASFFVATWTGLREALRAGLGVSFFFAFATPVFAQLKWEKLEQTFAPGPLDKSVVAKYRFTNVGSSTISIKDVRTSCGCTTAALEKWEYAPGESGEIEANFQFAGSNPARLTNLGWHDLRRAEVFALP